MIQVDGVVDHRCIVDKFAKHFSKICQYDSHEGSKRLHEAYASKRELYWGDPMLKDNLFTAELVERIIGDIKRGKAAGLDSLTAEHLQYCHYLIHVVLAKLFNMIVYCGYVPTGFGCSYTVPIPKQSGKEYSHAFKVDDFRGISISPVISKIFEHCILGRFRRYFVTNDNQFSYKRRVGCATAVHSLRCVTDYYINNGSTVNLCALDLTKAFDRVNHHGLLLKLMDRSVPIQLLQVLEFWFLNSYTCVKWHDAFSSHFKISIGIRQGGVLSPILFNIYIDSIVTKVNTSCLGCTLKQACVSILIYADDILLIAPTVTALQFLVNTCCEELSHLAMDINRSKTVCMRIGPRYRVECSNITVSQGQEIKWVQQFRYLGVTIVCAATFKCDFSERRRNYFRSFNAVYGRIGRTASCEVIIELIKTKCLPVLCYACEAVPLQTRDYNSFDYVLNCTFRKIFNTKDNNVVDYCRDMFKLASIAEIIATRRSTFVIKFATVDNFLCSILS